MFQIAYSAGHYYGTAGKRIPGSLDPEQTREWTLNDRVARYFTRAALSYEDVELLRTDDSSGQTQVKIAQRAAGANRWGADLYLDIHHNAGIDGGSGGGVEAFSYPGSEKGRTYRDAIYESIIAAGGLRGNRSQPCREKAFDILRKTNMPAVLVEYGFMDSTTDAPVILTEDYAKKVAYATMEAIARIAGLTQQASGESYPREQFIREVQAAIGAEVDGKAGPETISKTVTISASKNDRHPAVRPIQKRLASLGYTQVGEPDGHAGPKFTAAVKAFQRDHGKNVDGEITAKNITWRKLLSL